ncbi:MAG: hypothetical protein DWC11_04780 [Candidatus Poseidoniales archaeon]|nr:MAG: hypothetical protein DWC11_04780 [Candidatus Poseidoniales archaeon]
MEPPKWSDENAAPDLSGNPVPSGVNLTDSAISGDVHHTVVNNISPYGAQGQMIFVQPPSGAAKVMGILIIIYASFGLLGALASLLGGSFFEALLGEVASQDPDALGFDPAGFGQYMMLTGLIGLVTSAGTLLGGIWTMQYQRRGVHLGLAMIMASFLLGLVLAFMYPEFSDSGFGMGATVIMSVLGSGFCGLMVAIPLMVSNNGLDDSSLFPSTSQ